MNYARLEKWQRKLATEMNSETCVINGAAKEEEIVNHHTNPLNGHFYSSGNYEKEIIPN